MKKKNNSGFTLLELIIYTAIFASVAGLFTSVLVSTTKVTTNQTVTTQISNELNLLLSTVQTQVRNSSSIECVGADQSTCSSSTSPGPYLKLRFENPALDPTCIYLSGTQILLAQGPDATNPQNCTSATQAITTGKVNATSLTFTKYDFPGGHATVQVDATLAYNSTSPDMQISRSLHSAIGRVSAATFDSDLLPDLTNSRSIGTSVGPKTWKNIFLGGGLVTPKISPSTDSTTAIQITKADGLTNVINIDTTNGNVGINTATPTAGKLVVNGTIDVSSNKITSLATPTVSTDAATKGYVDAAGGGKTRYVFSLLSGTSWTVPTGVTYVNVTLVGGGGGAGNFPGGSGSIVKSSVVTTPGATIAYSIGAGGAGGVAGTYTAGSPGGTTTFTGATSAPGGAGGPCNGGAGANGTNGIGEKGSIPAVPGGTCGNTGGAGGSGRIDIEYWQ